MRLYGHRRSLCTRKVLLTFAEKGHDCELVHVDLRTGEHKHKAHLARHPFGRVPVLEDGAFRLYESGAIMRYLDETLGTGSLIPAPGRDRAYMEQWLSVESSYLEPAISSVSAQLSARSLFGAPADPVELARGRREVREVVDVLECALSAREGGAGLYLAGPTLSLADIVFIPCFQLLTDTGQADLYEAKPNVEAWWRRVSSRPSWQSVLEAGRARSRRVPERGVTVALAAAS